MTQTVLLIADDQPDNLVIFSAILTHHGYGLVLAANPKLILMDLQMSVVDG